MRSEARLVLLFGVPVGGVEERRALAQARSAFVI